MNRRDFIKSIGAVAGLAIAGDIYAGRGGKPNVVLIMVDDMGFSDIGCYGGEIDTPNIDKLAHDGLRLTQFYNTAKCSPSRAALLSGSYHVEVKEKELTNCMTIPEVLKTAGYRTLMTGKWHLQSDPVSRGFDRYFGHLSGATNFFTGDDSFRLDKEKFNVPQKGFYTTDANTDYAIEFLDEAGKIGKPFFLYIAYNAPHYPLHAWPEDIEKYKGKYMAGWDEIRERRHKRQLEMGIVKKQWGMTPRDEVVGDWDSLSEEQKKKEDLMMAVYAAMVDRVDQNIGRLVTKLKAMKKFENTLFLFLSDNGGCPFDRIETPDIPPGPAESYWSYNTGWAQVSNTPFRLYKRNQHEGGISTPLIAHWPGKIKAGSISDQPGQIVDIMATLIDITGAHRPETKDGQKLRPLRGSSLVPIFEGKMRDGEKELFFTYSNYRALRIGKWKISWLKGPWELYDIEADRCELNDLALEMPEKVREMSAKYDAWLKELGHVHKVKGNN